MNKIKYKIISIVMIICFICGHANVSYGGALSTLLEAGSVIENFGKNFPGALVFYFSNMVLVGADKIQSFANSIQSGAPDETRFEYKQLKKYDALNKYTKADKYDSNSTSLKRVEVKKAEFDNDDDDFSKDTPIPIIIGDLYSVGAGNIDYFDINLLTGMNTKTEEGKALHPADSPWMKIRSIASTLTHGTIYIASAILIISLIWCGIGIVRSSFNNPEAHAKYKKGLNRFEIAVVMMITCILTIGLCAYGAQALVKIMGINGEELPIRVNVEDTYSFSTTLTGYVGYLASTANVDSFFPKFIWTLSYLFLTILNLIFVFAMIARILLLWGLAIVGALISALYVFDEKKVQNFKTWMKVYISIAMLQVVLCLIYKLILDIVL